MRQGQAGHAAYLSNRFPLPYGFACVLTHNDPKYAISCGAGRRGSNVRNWKHAFLMRILGRKR